MAAIVPTGFTVVVKKPADGQLTDQQKDRNKAHNRKRALAEREKPCSRPPTLPRVTPAPLADRSYHRRYPETTHTERHAPVIRKVPCTRPPRFKQVNQMHDGTRMASALFHCTPRLSVRAPRTRESTAHCRPNSIFPCSERLTMQ
jgi:hypothetical protein